MNPPVEIHTLHFFLAILCPGLARLCKRAAHAELSIQLMIQNIFKRVLYGDVYFRGYNLFMFSMRFKGQHGMGRWCGTAACRDVLKLTLDSRLGSQSFFLSDGFRKGQLSAGHFSLTLLSSVYYSTLLCSGYSTLLCSVYYYT